MAQQNLKVHRFPVGLATQAEVVFHKGRVAKAHALGQFSKYLGVGFCLSLRRNGGAVQQGVGVAVTVMHIPVFELCGGRQDVVGVISGVGLKMLKHHGKQITACKTLHHTGRVGRHRHRVAVVHHQGLNGWAKFSAGRAQQVVSNGAHVDAAWPAPGQQIGALQCI